jgi:hypothetical protein
MLPNSERAFVAPTKLRDYLLSPGHPVGRFKAALFSAYGYTQENWETLRDDLLTIARSGNVSPGQPSAFGEKFEVSGILVGPSGRSSEFVTVWLVRRNEDFPRFVTAFPR